MVKLVNLVSLALAVLMTLAALIGGHIDGTALWWLFGLMVSALFGGLALSCLTLLILLGNVGNFCDLAWRTSAPPRSL